MAENNKIEWDFKNGSAEQIIHWSFLFDGDVVDWLNEKGNPEAALKSILRTAYEKETKVTPAKLRKLFCGKRIDVEALNVRKWCASEFNGHVEMDKVVLESWSGDEYTYHFDIWLDQNFCISDMGTMSCEKLCGDDVRGSGYRSVRVDPDEYKDLKLIIEDALVVDK